MPDRPGVFPFGVCEAGDPTARFLGELPPPDEIAVGESVPVWVVFANCGQDSWSVGPAVGSEGVKLGSLAPPDNYHWGMNRVALPGEVGPGELVRFDFEITGPSTPGSFDYQWQMVDEGVAWLSEPTPPHEVAVQTDTTALSGLWAGTAHFVVDQDPVPVLGASSGHREAFAVNRTDLGPATVFLYHRCFGQSAADAAICLSISEDGGDVFGQFLGQIVGPDAGHIFSVAPAVIRKGSRWYMVYEESNVAALYWAESSDGIRWTKRGQLLSKDPGAWDGGANATPGAFVDVDGTIYVFYAGFRVGGEHMSVGFASGGSMESLRKYAGNPVFSPPAGGWSRGQVSMPRVVAQGDWYYMIYEGAETDFSCEGYNRYGWGMARSRDLRTWEPLATNPLGQTNAGCGDDMPSLFVRYDGNVFAYHTSSDTRRIVREHLRF